MKISRTASPSSSPHFKKPRDIHRVYDFVDLLKKDSSQDLVTKEDEYYVRRYKKKKDGQLELLYELKKEQTNKKDYANSLLEQLNYVKRK
ncbi:MAG: hypothetical protein KBT36_12390 [Kurthia sp.]|nr:hypothetical protein [Candidatus Kurthia equi]